MHSPQIPAGFASSRRKRGSSSRCKMSIFSLAKAGLPNFLQRTRPAECRCWSSTTGHVSQSRSRSAAIWRGYTLSLICSDATCANKRRSRSEEHTSELQSRENVVCRLLLEKKKKKRKMKINNKKKKKKKEI